MKAENQAPALTALAERINGWGRELGFQHIGITDIRVDEAATHLRRWLQDGFAGKMSWMARHAHLRGHPERLVPDTVRVISARMNYLPGAARRSEDVLEEPKSAYVARYALGGDYHKLIRKRLQKLIDRIRSEAAAAGCRAFSDSAPVLEKALAEKAGLGWIGKHSNLLARDTGSWFFLGEIYTDLPLPVDTPARGYCGSCCACIDACPTGAIVAPYRVDARRCISYLTIELDGAIPEELRPMIGNRIFGCDDCQIVCPWNRFATPTLEPAFEPRHGLDGSTLVTLFTWSEAEFLDRTRGSAIRRLGYERWLRNVAVALGNAPATGEVVAALHKRREHPSALVREHVHWALKRHSQPVSPKGSHRRRS